MQMGVVRNDFVQEEPLPPPLLACDASPPADLQLVIVAPPAEEKTSVPLEPFEVMKR